MPWGMVALAAGTYLGARETADATEAAARAAEFHPYSVSGLFGSANINEDSKTAELSLSPEYQMLHNALFGRVMGRLGLSSDLINNITQARQAQQPTIQPQIPWWKNPQVRGPELFGNMRGFANGGYPLPGETSIMGERGPEILRTPQGTQIVGAGGPQIVNTPSGGQVVPIIGGQKRQGMFNQATPNTDPTQTPGTIFYPGGSPQSPTTTADTPETPSGPSAEEQGYVIPGQEELGMGLPSEQESIQQAAQALNEFGMPFGLDQNASYDQVLNLLREQAAPGEEQRRLELENRLMAQGMLGSTGGALRSQSLREAQEQADLARQLQAFGTTMDINQMGYGRAEDTLNRELGFYAADQQARDAQQARLMRDLNLLFGIGGLPGQYAGMGLQAGAAGASAGANQGQFLMAGGQAQADMWSSLGAGLFGASQNPNNP